MECLQSLEANAIPIKSEHTQLMRADLEEVDAAGEQVARQVVVGQVHETDVVREDQLAEGVHQSDCGGINWLARFQVLYALVVHVQELAYYLVLSRKYVVYAVLVQRQHSAAYH